MTDLKFALRQLKKNPGFTATVILLLALGIGMNTMVFTIVNAVLFKPIPVPNDVNLLRVSGRSLKGGAVRLRLSYPDFLEIRRQSGAFAALEAAWNHQAVVSENDNPPERLRIAGVSTGFFDMLRTRPILGRGFSDAEDRPGREAENLVILSGRLWESRYGGDPDVLGRATRIDGQPATIVGVMPKGFQFPADADCWTSLVSNAFLKDRSHRRLAVFGALKETADLEEARAELAMIGRRLAEAFPDANKDITLTAGALRDAERIESELRAVFLIMLAAVGFVLLIACSNVANLTLGRVIKRRFETSVRAALGAPRWRLARQILIESVLLSVIGGVLGLAISVYGARFFDIATLDMRPSWIEFTMDVRAFAFFGAIAALSGIAFGLVPALRASRVDLNAVLARGARAVGDLRGGRMSGSLVVLQFAMTLVLLAGAGLMARNFLAAQAVNDFVPTKKILAAHARLPDRAGDRYAKKDDRRRFYQDAVSRLKSLPGVTHAAAGSSVPAIEDNERRSIEIEGRPADDAASAPEAIFIVQTPEFLSLIELPVIEGRGLLEADGEGGEAVAVVTRRFADRHWPGESALGKRFRCLSDAGSGDWISVAGVSADIIGNARGPRALPFVFLPHSQEPRGEMFLLVRSSNDPLGQARAVRSVAQDLDPALPLTRVRTLQASKERNHSELVIFGALFSTFALVALLMASAGVYAVVAQAAESRAKELGVRMALGATSFKIYGTVLSRGAKQMTLGLSLGLLLAFATTRLLEGNLLLTTVSAQDPLVFGMAAALLIGVGLAACWLPARRAAKTDPMEALRTE